MPSPGSLDPMFTHTGALQDTVSITGTATGFLHLGNRWYDPPAEPDAGVGNQAGPARFTQPDSTTQLANPADGNLYAYAGDNPTNYIDPTGQAAVGAVISTIFGVAGVIAGVVAAGLAAAEAAH